MHLSAGERAALIRFFRILIDFPALNRKTEHLPDGNLSVYIIYYQDISTGEQVIQVQGIDRTQNRAGFHRLSRHIINFDGSARPECTGYDHLLSFLQWIRIHLDMLYCCRSFIDPGHCMVVIQEKRGMRFLPVLSWSYFQK